MLLTKLKILILVTQGNSCDGRKQANNTELFALKKENQMLAIQHKTHKNVLCIFMWTKGTPPISIWDLSSAFLNTHSRDGKKVKSYETPMICC